MYIRCSTPNDLPELLELYEDARTFIAANGCAAQWADGYPPRELIEQNIRSGNSYVCTDGADICGTFFFALCKEPGGSAITDDAWPDDELYGVIHRLAVRTRNKGVGSFCLNWCQQRCNRLRVVTHRDNIPMQKLLIKNGFTRCGIIDLPDGTERIAYQYSAAPPN